MQLSELSTEELILYVQLIWSMLFIYIPLVLLTILGLQGKLTFSLFSQSAPVSIATVQTTSFPLSNPTSLEETFQVLPPEPTEEELALDSELSTSIKKEVENIAMDFVKRYEETEGREIEDVSMYYTGYDLKSYHGDSFRAIEVKGKSGHGDVLLTANEWKTAQNLGETYYLYIVENVSSSPKLRIIQDPAKQLSPKPNRLQYILSRSTYLAKVSQMFELD